MVFEGPGEKENNYLLFCNDQLFPNKILRTNTLREKEKERLHTETFGENKTNQNVQTNKKPSLNVATSL